MKNFRIALILFALSYATLSFTADKLPTEEENPTVTMNSGASIPKTPALFTPDGNEEELKQISEFCSFQRKAGEIAEQMLLLKCVTFPQKKTQKKCTQLDAQLRALVAMEVARMTDNEPEKVTTLTQASELMGKMGTFIMLYPSWYHPGLDG